MLPGFGPAPKRMERAIEQWTKRAYQKQAASRFFGLLKEGKKSPLLVMATGTGKTRTAALGVVKPWIDERRGPVLWIAHLNTLIEQTRGELSCYLEEFIGLEQGGRFWESERVCVASMASLYREERLRRICKRPTLVIYDEAHHSVSDRNHAVIDAMVNAATCGLTATPDRADGIALRRRFDSVAIEYPIVIAIQDGYLVPVLMDVATIPGLDLGHLTKRTFNDKNVGKVVGKKEVLNTIIRKGLEKVESRRTAWFFPTVEVAHTASALLNEIKPGSSIAIDGTKMHVDEKKSRIKRFKAAEFQHVCNVGVLAEGYDDSGIGAVCLVAPTESQSVYLQQMGRGTRNVCEVDNYYSADERRAAIALSAKPDLLVVDFVGNSGRLQTISALDVLAGDDVDEETLGRAKEIAKKSRMSPAEAVEKARRELASEREAEAKRIADAKLLDMQFHRINPFDANVGHKSHDAINSALNDPIERIAEFIKDNGINIAGLAEHDLRRIQREIYQRKETGLSSHKQCNSLNRLMIDAWGWSKKQATAVIGHMAVAAKSDNGRWTRPSDSTINEILARHRTREPGDDDE